MTEIAILFVAIGVIISAFAIVGLQVQILRNREQQSEMNRAFNEIHEKQIQLNAHVMSNISTTELRIGILELKGEN